MKTLVILCAALGENLFSHYAKADFWNQLNPKGIQSGFPALTCPQQAVLRTGGNVALHGMGTSGYFDRTLKKTFFWEQSAKLYEGKRIWEDFRRQGGKVAQVCLQQCPGLDSDFYLSPAPIHKHHGGMIQDFFCEPPELYREICSSMAMKFNLMHYWGPFTSLKSSRWIAGATAELLKRLQREDKACVFSYLPHLDYEPQRHGPDSPQTKKSFAELESLLDNLLISAKQYGFEVILSGDYEITAVNTPIYPNRILAQKGFLKLRNVKGMLYPNLHSSRAFALVDHQVCHIYAEQKEDLPELYDLFSTDPNIEQVQRRDKSPELDHPRCGELILTAKEHAWFAYKWWDRDSEAPDYATHVDIHNKPGFDPLEIYFKLFPPMSTPQDCNLLKGSHGRDCRVMAAATFPLPETFNSFQDLPKLLKERMS